MDNESIHDLIGTIYEAASAPDLWGPVIRRIRALTSSHYGKLWFGSVDYSALEHATRSGDFLAFEHPDVSLTEFGNLVQSLPDSSSFTEPYAACVSSLPTNRVLNGHELVPIDEFRKSEWFNLVAKPLGMVHTLGAVTGWQDGRVYGLTFYRQDDKSNYAKTEQRLLEVFAPHFHRSLSLSSRLQRASATTRALQNSIDALSSVLVLLDEAGQVVFVNAAARHLLTSSKTLSVRRNKLEAKSHADSAKLAHLIRCVTGAGGKRPTGGAVAVRHAEGGPPLQIIAAPIASETPNQFTDDMGAAVAILAIHDPATRPARPQDIMMRLFGLTPTEANLLLALGDGRTLRQYSDERRVSYNTARTHLRSVFAKTDTSKQSDLVRLVSGFTHTLALLD